MEGRDGAPSFDVGADYLFLGRTFREYRRMFGLDPESLPGTAVLDCPGGPSSFAAVAEELGCDVTAVDPEYGRSPATLERACEDAIQRTREQLPAMREAFVWDEYGDIETRIRYLRAAASRFLADYARYPGRYVRAGLPDLPFETDTFDLALSGNFLFLYDDRLDRDIHVAALRELARVAGEVRVFPLASLDRTRSAYVSAVTDRLRDAGYAVTTRTVPYEFQSGATEMLVIGG